MAQRSPTPEFPSGSGVGIWKTGPIVGVSWLLLLSSHLIVNLTGDCCESHECIIISTYSSAIHLRLNLVLKAVLTRLFSRIDRFGSRIFD